MPGPDLRGDSTDLSEIHPGGPLNFKSRVYELDFPPRLSLSAGLIDQNHFPPVCLTCSPEGVAHGLQGWYGGKDTAVFPPVTEPDGAARSDAGTAALRWLLAGSSGLPSINVGQVSEGFIVWR